MKTTKEDFAAYMRWQKYILSTYPKLPERHSRPTLILYVMAMATHGTNGLECFASDAFIGKEIGIANRSVVGSYRRLALKLGWFVKSGKRRGRAEALNISIPSEPLPEDSAHIPGISHMNCAACQPLLRTRTSGEVWEIHGRALRFMAQRDLGARQSNAPLG